MVAALVRKPVTFPVTYELAPASVGCRGRGPNPLIYAGGRWSSLGLGRLISVRSVVQLYPGPFPDLFAPLGDSRLAGFVLRGVRPDGVHCGVLPAGNCDAAAERFILNAEALGPPVAQTPRPPLEEAARRARERCHVNPIF